MFLFYSSSLCFVIVVINWKWESRFLKIVNYFYFYRKKPSWILKIRTCKGRTINLVIKEDRSSAFGCNHTDFVTGNSKFWCHDALQCSFLFRNTWLAAIWRDFFNYFYHQYGPFSVSASCCFQCSFIFRLAMVASDRISQLFHRLHQFPSI